MKVLESTCFTPQENLACDEALVDLCENGFKDDILRFWEPQDYFVVLGYSSKISHDVNTEACNKAGVPLLRRISGGGTVLQGPGCLNYSLILNIENSNLHRTITHTNHHIMQRHREILEKALNRNVTVQGHTDLTIGNLKFSGNSQRRKQRAALFHGTFLLNMDFKAIEKFLLNPPRQPEYRLNRSHSRFLVNLKSTADLIKDALRESWGAGETLNIIPTEQIQSLVREKYSNSTWNLQF